MDSELDSQILLNTAQQFGTPLYIYNADSITEQYKKLTNAFKGGNTTFFYACKALTTINVL